MLAAIRRASSRVSSFAAVVLERHASGRPVAEPDLAARYRIQAIPTMVLMRGGREIGRHSGVMSVGKLRGWLEQNLQA
jgi:hypothetical protein